MQIDIRAHGFSLTGTLCGHTDWRLRFALTYCDAHIKWVIMRLSGINESRSSSDKRCHLQHAGRTLVHKINHQQFLLKRGCPLVSTENPQHEQATEQTTEDKDRYD